MLDEATAAEKMQLLAQSGVELGHTLVAGQLYQASMEIHVQGEIGIDILSILHFGHIGTKFGNFSQTNALCSQPAGQAKQMGAYVINLCRLSHTHFPHEYTAIRDHLDQVAFLQTATSLPDRSPANT